MLELYCTMVLTNLREKRKKFIGNQQCLILLSQKKNFWPYNFCIGEIQCALGAELVKKIDKLNAIRIKRANIFIKKLKNYPEVKFQKQIKGYKNVYHCLVAKFQGNKSESKRDFFYKNNITKS